MIFLIFSFSWSGAPEVVRPKQLQKCFGFDQTASSQGNFGETRYQQLC